MSTCPQARLKWATEQRCIHIEITSYKIPSLTGNISVIQCVVINLILTIYQKELTVMEHQKHYHQYILDYKGFPELQNFDDPILIKSQESIKLSVYLYS